MPSIVEEGVANSNFQTYLEASYKYYITMEDTGLSDYEYDLLCNTLKKEWDEITHPYKHLATLEDMSCGTGFSITKEDYPKEISEHVESTED